MKIKKIAKFFYLAFGMILGIAIYFAYFANNTKLGESEEQEDLSVADENYFTEVVQLNYPATADSKTFDADSLRGFYTVSSSPDPDFKKDLLFISHDGRIYALEKSQAHYRTFYGGQTQYINSMTKVNDDWVTPYFTCKELAELPKDRNLKLLYDIDQKLAALATKLNPAGISTGVKLVSDELNLKQSHLDYLNAIEENIDTVSKYIYLSSAEYLIATDLNNTELTFEGDEFWLTSGLKYNPQELIKEMHKFIVAETSNKE